MPTTDTHPQMLQLHKLGVPKYYNFAAQAHPRAYYELCSTPPPLPRRHEVIRQHRKLVGVPCKIIWNNLAGSYLFLPPSDPAEDEIGLIFRHATTDSHLLVDSLPARNMCLTATQEQSKCARKCEASEKQVRARCALQGSVVGWGYKKCWLFPAG